MADLLIDDVDDEVIAALERRAIANGSTVEEEARAALTASLAPAPLPAQTRPTAP